MRRVKVEYTGSYPCTCMGEIIVYLDDKEEFRTDSYSFHSTGSIWFDDEWMEHIEEGELVWSNYDEKTRLEAWANLQLEKDIILEEVESVLDKVSVCCGGCV